jgi:hypothetical protein
LDCGLHLRIMRLQLGTSSDDPEGGNRRCITQIWSSMYHSNHLFFSCQSSCLSDGVKLIVILLCFSLANRRYSCRKGTCFSHRPFPQSSNRTLLSLLMYKSASHPCNIHKQLIRQSYISSLTFIHRLLTQATRKHHRSIFHDEHRME